jgi:RNA polymerase-interacting CarD/CdnL/TRCF family regulator
MPALVIKSLAGTGLVEILAESSVEIRARTLEGNEMSVPIADARLRDPIDALGAERLLARLGEPAAATTQPWNERYRRWLATASSGELAPMVDAYREMRTHAGAASFGERKLAQALRMLVLEELAHALGVTTAAIEDRAPLLR